MIPNFFLVGAPKAGTTSLCQYLEQHPQVFLCPIKEPGYFADEIRPENFSEALRPKIRQEIRDVEDYLAGPMLQKRLNGPVIEWSSYLKLFSTVNGETAVGDASVHYLWSPSAARNIAARIPQARILMLLRHPADRAYSQYLHGVTSGLIGVSFREHVHRSLGHNGKFDLYHPFLEFGMYSQQVKRYLESFPRDRVFIALYEEYRDRPQGTLRHILGFLGVDPDVPIDQSERHREPRVPRSVGLGHLLKKSGAWNGAKRLIPAAMRPLVRSAAVRPRKDLVMDPKDRRYLVAYYRDDIGKLAALLNRDLDAWMK